MLFHGGIDWNGESALTLLDEIAHQQGASISLQDCFRVGRGMAFTLRGRSEDSDSFMVQVFPYIRDPMSDGGYESDAGFATAVSASRLSAVRPLQWPDHFIITVTNVTEFQMVDDIKSDLIETVAYKYRDELVTCVRRHSS